MIMISRPRSGRPPATAKRESVVGIGVIEMETFHLFLENEIERCDKEESRLSQLGLSPQLIDVILKGNAAKRHESRVIHAAKMIYKTVTEEPTEDGMRLSFQQECALATVLLLQECVGVGPSLYESKDASAMRLTRGPMSRRIGPFRNFGKGRRRATDGPAWSAAIEEAMLFFFSEASKGIESPVIILAPMVDANTIDVDVASCNPDAPDSGWIIKLPELPGGQPGEADWWMANLAYQCLLKRLSESTCSHHGLPNRLPFWIHIADTPEEWGKPLDNLLLKEKTEFEKFQCGEVA